MEQAAAPLVDDRQVRRAFARAAAGYDGAAFVAREVGGRELLYIPFQWPPKQAQQATAQGQSELGHITLDLKP